MNHATRVRECASALKTAIADAVADGYRVDGVGNLNDIAVSETAKVKQPESVAATPEAAPSFDKPSGFRRPKI